nr:MULTISPECIES: MFS transporter [unclassified Roseobacter]
MPFGDASCRVPGKGRWYLVKAGIGFLVLGYVLSQFYRAFLAVLAPVLEADIGASTDDLARASGLWFAAFALMQLPVGWALDHLGPRRTSSILFALGGAGGAALFAVAQGPVAIQIAMVLIGLGCAPVLMASYFIFARVYSPGVFATLAGLTVGVSSLGNIASALPMAWAVEAIGWRETVAGLAALTLAVAAGMALLVRDPEKLDGTTRGSLFDLLRNPGLWLILPLMFICYAPAAGMRGLWIAPYVTDIYGADLVQIGHVTLAMSIAMVIGSFAYGPLDRLFGTRKWVLLPGNLLAGLLCIVFWFAPPTTLWSATVLFAAIGLFGASYPMMIAHGRSFFPPHLMGRGVTLLNLFGMGGAGVMQFASGPYFAHLSTRNDPEAAYAALFGAFGVVVLIGVAIYLFSQDRTD